MRTRCGCSPCARQIRCTELALMPTAAAMAAAVQCVVSPGGSPVVVSADHPAATSAPSGGMPRRPGLVAQQARDPRGHEPLLPAPDRDLARARPPHDLHGAVTIGGQQHDPRPPDMLLRAVAIGHHRLQTSPVGGVNFDDDPFAHAPKPTPRTAGAHVKSDSSV